MDRLQNRFSTKAQRNDALATAVIYSFFMEVCTTSAIRIGSASGRTVRNYHTRALPNNKRSFAYNTKDAFGAQDGKLGVDRRTNKFSSRL